MFSTSYTGKVTREMTSEDLVWRDLVADWHLKRPAPLECACDDDTEDGAFCPPSIEWADEEYASRHEPSLAGPADPWDHQVWVAAWGHNAPVFTNYNDYKLPTPPSDLIWSAIRVLVGGAQAIELSLYRFTEDRLIPLLRSRVFAEPSTVVARARRMLKEVMERGQ